MNLSEQTLGAPIAPSHDAVHMESFVSASVGRTSPARTLRIEGPALTFTFVVALSAMPMLAYPAHASQVSYPVVVTASSSTSTADAWARYVASLEAARQPHVKSAATVWKAFAHDVTELPAPRAGEVPGDVFQFSWDVGPLHLDVEVAADEPDSYDWFFANHDDGSCDSGSAAIGTPLPAQLIAHLRSLSA